MDNFSDELKRVRKWLASKDKPEYRLLHIPATVGVGVFCLTTVLTGRVRKSCGYSILTMGTAAFVGEMQNRRDMMFFGNAAAVPPRPLTEEQQYQISVVKAVKLKEQQVSAIAGELQSSEIHEKMSDYVNRKLSEEDEKS